MPADLTTRIAAAARDRLTEVQRSALAATVRDDATDDQLNALVDVFARPSTTAAERGRAAARKRFGVPPAAA